MKLKAILRFLIGATLIGVCLFVVTSNKIIYDFTTRWKDFVSCAPPLPKNVFYTGFVYLIEYVGLLGLIIAFNKPVIIPKKKRRRRAKRIKIKK